MKYTHTHPEFLRLLIGLARARILGLGYPVVPFIAVAVPAVCT